MSVELEPAELGFKRPFTNEVSQVLRLANPHPQPVAFKVKTTAPKQYCVRPNSGRIEPGSTVEVQVLLQAMKEDPPLDAKCRDKFLVQSVIIPEAVVANQNVVQVWSTVESTARGSIQEKKIRVNFLPSDTQPNGVGAAATSHHAEDLPPAYTHGASPAAATAVTPQKSAPLADEKSPSFVDQSIASVASARETVQNTAASTVSAVAAAVPTSSEQLQRQLDEAKATIARLQQQAADGLRQRKVVDSTDATATTTSSDAGSKLALQNQQVPGGVSVQIVAALCLLSFIIAYLFF